MERDKAVIEVQNAILAHEYLAPDKYELTDIWKDIGADSLDVVEICMLIEDKLKVEVPNNLLDKIKTIDDLVKLVEQYA